MIACKRIYDPPGADDGRRLLVDRLWPRGVSREAARLDDWLKELATSDGLRRWFGHNPALWEEFRARYREELKTHVEMLDDLRAEAKRGSVTLLFAARDTEHNNAVVLKEMLNEGK